MEEQRLDFGTGPLPLEAYGVVAAIGGGLGGWLVGKVRGAPVPGAIAGLVAAATALPGVHLYTRGRQSVYNWELVMVSALVVLPALGVFHGAVWARDRIRPP